jgi:hypothetical protein
MGLIFKTGRGFYEITKPEIIQDSKEIVLMDRVTGDIYENDGARLMLGIKSSKNKQKVNHPDYVVFIQSKSATR